MSESPNQITPRHFAVMLILSRLQEIQQRIEENDIERDATNYFRSQIDVWLHRAREELESAISYLQNKEDEVE